MHLREELSHQFDYERWANMRWLKPAAELGCSPIMIHILQAQIIWLSRIEGRPAWTPTVENFVADLDRSVRSWQRLMLSADLNQVVHYTTSRGDEFDNTVGEIARHVLNHGTYHRGELRGRAGAAGLESFEDTDYILFCREHK